MKCQVKGCDETSICTVPVVLSEIYHYSMSVVVRLCAIHKDMLERGSGRSFLDEIPQTWLDAAPKYADGGDV